MSEASQEPPADPHRRKKARWVVPVVCVLFLAGLAGFLMLVSRGPLGDARTDAPDLDPEEDLFVYDGVDAADWASPRSEPAIRAMLADAAQDNSLAPLKIDYPAEGSIFPPEIVAPTVLWHDRRTDVNTWLIDVTLRTTGRHIYVVTGGRLPTREIDPRCVTDANAYTPPPYQTSAKAWTPDGVVWKIMQRHSVSEPLRISIHGLDETRRVVSAGRVNITTSKDPVGAPIFYRDVPLMPSETKDGVIKPLKAEATPLIKWRLRYLDEPDAPVVMTHLPTCANCHTFSGDGKTIAMDMDGPSGDKGAHVVKTVGEKMVIAGEDVFTWNSFERNEGDQQSGGLFPHISPDGRYVVATVHESVFVQNYMDYRFLQTFYPTRGILAIYERKTGEIRRLPGADNPEYVQSNGVWSPDGKSLVFIRAPARDAYGPGERAEYANDPRETPMRYDLYRIPFNDGKGGVPEPVVGASNNGMSNSFPKFSPDGKWIVYVQAKTGLLMRPDSRLFIIPAQGGEPREMNCNMEPMNSWHSWSPNSRWLVFVSKVNTPYTEMFLTHIDEEGNDSPAILVPDSTAPNRAVNLPEFADIPRGGLVDITTPAVAYRRHLDRGRELTKQGKVAEALAELETSVQLKGDYPDTHQALGDLFSRHGNPTRAIPYYERALEIEPRYFVAHNNLADALARVNRYQEAITHYREAIRINPDAYPTLTGLGSALSQVGKHEEAVGFFRRALEVNPRYQEARYHLGIALGILGERTEAIEQLRRTIELNPEHPDAHYNIGALLSQQGEFKEAIGYFRQTIKLKPDHFQAHASLAWILATHPDPALRDGKEAVRHATIANRLTGDRTAGVLNTLAAAYAEAGQFDDAVKAAVRALVIAETQRLDPLAAQIRSCLDLYKTKTPLRMKD